MAAQYFCTGQDVEQKLFGVDSLAAGSAMSVRDGPLHPAGGKRACVFMAVPFDCRRR
jgi:hypothetical protein